MAATNLLDRDRLSVLTGAIVLVMALARFMELPSRAISTTVLGSRLGLDLSVTTIVILVIGGLGATAAESLVRSHPVARSGQMQLSAMHWILPGFLSLGLAGWLSGIGDLGLWTLGILISAVLLPLALASEYLVIDPGPRHLHFIHWGQKVLITLSALLLYTGIYALRVRSLLSGTAVLLITALLAARLLMPIASESRKALPYGLVIGILLGQLTWVLNYWPLSPIQGGLLLLLSFYVVVGLTDHALRGSFNRRIVLEHLGLALLILILVAVVIN